MSIAALPDPPIRSLIRSARAVVVAVAFASASDDEPVVDQAVLNRRPCSRKAYPINLGDSVENITEVMHRMLLLLVRDGRFWVAYLVHAASALPLGPSLTFNRRATSSFSTALCCETAYINTSNRPGPAAFRGGCHKLAKGATDDRNAAIDPLSRAFRSTGAEFAGS